MSKVWVLVKIRMKATIVLLSLLCISFIEIRPSQSQTLTSPFVFLCRKTCGGYGVFRRLCCMVDSLCCSKPNSCPEDPNQDVLIPFCQSCSEDIDCMWTAKCCESNGKKCCTSVRKSVLFRKNSSQRAKDKSDNTGSTKPSDTIDEEEEEK